MRLRRIPELWMHKEIFNWKKAQIFCTTVNNCLFIKEFQLNTDIQKDDFQFNK